MVLHPVLETMIVEIGKGVQQVCFALHPLRVGGRKFLAWLKATATSEDRPVAYVIRRLISCGGDAARRKRRSRRRAGAPRSSGMIARCRERRARRTARRLGMRGPWACISIICCADLTAARRDKRSASFRPERCRPMAGCASRIEPSVVATTRPRRSLHDLNWMHPQGGSASVLTGTASASTRTMISSAALDFISRPARALRHLLRQNRAGRQRHVVERLHAFLLLAAILLLFPA